MEIYQARMLIILVSILFRDCFVFGNEINEIIGSMSREVVLKYFTSIKRNQCVGVLTEDNSKVMEYLQPIDFPIYHVQMSSQFKYSQQLDEDFESYTWDELLLEPMNAGCLAFIIQTNDLKFMVKTFERLYHTPKSIYRANRKFLFLPTKIISDEDFENTVEELFSMKELDMMPNLVLAKLKKEQDEYSKNVSVIIDQKRSYLDFISQGIFFANDCIKVELFTNKYIGPRPESAEAVYMDTWTLRDGFLHNADLYPDKISNVMGKELVLATFHYPPSNVVFENVDPPIYDGMEIIFMKEFAKSFNFTCKFLVKKDEWWGTVFTNGKGTGPSGRVSMGDADIGMNLLYIWEHEHFYLDFSDIYTYGELITIMPKPKLLPGWMTAVNPFSKGMWFAILASVVICTAALYITSKLSKFFLGKQENIPTMYSTWTECGFRTLGLLVLQTPPDERDWSTPRYVPMRHLVTWITMFFVVLTAAYGGGLASLLTLPRFEPPIDTIQELADRHALWGGSSANWSSMLLGSSLPKLIEMTKYFVAGTPESMAKVAEEGNMGIAFERLLGGGLALPEYINERTMRKFRIMNEAYYREHTVFHLRKGSPYMDALNTMIRRARETGLFSYWENLSIRLYMNSRDQLAVTISRQVEDPGPVKLRFRNVTGAFYLLFFGLVLAFVLFTLEIVTSILH